MSFLLVAHLVKIPDNEPTSSIRNMVKLRTFTCDTGQFQDATEMCLAYHDSNVISYIYYDFCDSVAFKINYFDNTVKGEPFIVSFWDQEVNKHRRVEFELARPPKIEYHYYINEKEVFFASDSTNSIYYTGKTQDMKDGINLKAVYLVNGKEKWTFKKNIPQL